jgi:hypothetical protein
MPRAHRHFLPGYVWHITHHPGEAVPNVPTGQPLRSVQIVYRNKRATEILEDRRWSEAVAVGGLSFVNTVKSELRFKAAHREVTEEGETYVLREESETYRSNLPAKMRR